MIRKFRIVPERKEHRPAVLALTRSAFGEDEEAAIIERLTADGLVIVSFVALNQDEVVGHIMFSRLEVHIEYNPIKVAALAPLAVKPEYQRKGIGCALVKAGLEALRALHLEAVIVLGHPNYYQRFGFNHQLVCNLRSPFTEFDEFMGLELVSGTLAGKSGNCIYPPAFNV